MKHFGLVPKLAFALAACITLVLSSCGSSDNGSIIIQGTINRIVTTSLLRNDGPATAPVVGAVVRGLGQSSVSDRNGQFNLNGDPGGVPTETLLDITIDGKRTVITVPTDGNAPFDLGLLLRPNGDIEVRVDEMDVIPEPEPDTGAAPQCSDGVDNDNDNATDFPDDLDCDNASDQTEDDLAVTTQCNDGIDNDADGLTDFAGDPGCDSITDNDESGDAQCNDGVDNDEDGLTDFPFDLGCSSATDNDESDDPQCSDALDNDGDGRIDFPDDPGCTSNNDNLETDATQCNDGVDNDGDGNIDLNDGGCFDEDDNDESDESDCGDGQDNDLDGFFDFPQDPGCDSVEDDDETDPVITDCAVNEKVCGNGSPVTCQSSCFCDDLFPIGGCGNVCFDTMALPTQCDDVGLGCSDGSTPSCPF